MGPVLCGALVACLGILLSPATCQAHGGGLSAGDYRTTIDETMPLLAGATIRVREDDLIEVGWRGPGRLIILGYGKEPYLRLGADGAFENRRSPSVQANLTQFGRQVLDPEADVRAEPAWRRISSRPVVVWHDHRAHWMSRTPPAAVRAAPDRPQLVGRWTIPIRIDGRPGSITGRIDYVPPPNVWAWWGAAIGLAAALGALAGWAPRPVALVATRLAAALAVGGGATLAASRWLEAPAEGLTTGIDSGLPPSVSAALWIAAAGVAALAWLGCRWRAPEAEWLMLLMGVWIVGGGALFGQLGALNHAVVSSALPATAVRVLVVIGLAGIPVAAVWAARSVGEIRDRGRTARAAPSR